MQKKIFSISWKIILFTLLILLISFVMVTFFVYNNQRTNMVEETDRMVALNIESTKISLVNMMLDGEAPIMVKTLAEMQELGDFEDMGVYRTNGVLAFSDYETLRFVNQFQEQYQFEETERLQDSREAESRSNDIIAITNSVQQFKSESRFLPDALSVEKFLPVINQKSCQICHGAGHSVRGVIHVKMSVASIYERIDRIRAFLIIVFSSLLVFLVIILFIMIRGIILNPIFKIEDTVIAVGKGSFDQRVGLKRNDELGVLAEKVDEMIRSVEERVRLAKYVSHSTEKLVTDGTEMSSGGEKKNMTLLFSDIRSFTGYTESHDPETVLKNLNRVLQVQVRVIEEMNGDIDKFVGDEIMARFEDPFKAVVAAIRMIRAVEESNKQAGVTLHIGIGINTGDVIAGHIGDENRLEYAVIGDTVNLAARLCSIAKGMQVLISDKTYQQVKSDVKAVLVSNQKIKGKKSAVNFYIVKSATTHGTQHDT